MTRARTARTATAVMIGALVLAIPAPVAAAPSLTPAPTRTYSYVDLGLLPGVPLTCCSSGADSINATGEVTGASAESGRLNAVAYRFQDGEMTSLGSIHPGYFGGSMGRGINDAGVVVGATYVNGTDPMHAFSYQNGTMTDLGTGFGPGSYSIAEDISNTGDIVGWRTESQLGTARATLWRDGQIIGLPGLSAGDSEATAVNDAGQVVGWSVPAGGAARAALWTGGTVTDLGDLGGDESHDAQARDISNTGAVVGSAPAPGGQVHAFLWRNGVMRDLGTLPNGDGLSYAYGVNVSNQVVGLATVAAGVPGPRNRAVIFDSGRAVELNTRVTNLPSGISLVSANAINDAGVIVGNSCEVQRCSALTGVVGRAFMLIPND